MRFPTSVPSFFDWPFPPPYFRQCQFFPVETVFFPSTSAPWPLACGFRFHPTWLRAHFFAPFALCCLTLLRQPVRPIPFFFLTWPNPSSIAALLFNHTLVLRGLLVHGTWLVSPGVLFFFFFFTTNWSAYVCFFSPPFFPLQHFFHQTGPSLGRSRLPIARSLVFLRWDLFFLMSVDFAGPWLSGPLLFAGIEGGFRILRPPLCPCLLCSDWAAGAYLPFFLGRPPLVLGNQYFHAGFLFFFPLLVCSDETHLIICGQGGYFRLMFVLFRLICSLGFCPCLYQFLFFKWELLVDWPFPADEDFLVFLHGVSVVVPSSFFFLGSID